ncbi:phage structural protein [Streptococcus pneumoniae]|nr:phage structural protein [Streptococcus pneumoniae]
MQALLLRYQVIEYPCFLQVRKLCTFRKGVINIDNGIFTASIQIGRFRTEQYHLNKDVNVIPIYRRLKKREMTKFINSSGSLHLNIYIEQVSQDIANNSSRVSWKLLLTVMELTAHILMVILVTCLYG